MTRLPRLGPRGEGWVAAQAVLIAVTGAAALRGPRWSGPRALRGAAGGALLAAGAATGLAAAAELGRALTPLPRPRPGARLADRGPYRRVRHPIYAGVGLGAAGLALLTSPRALVPAGLLLALLDLKARREEAWLVAHDPGYAAYGRRVRWRLVPGVQ